MPRQLETLELREPCALLALISEPWPEALHQAVNVTARSYSPPPPPLPPGGGGGGLGSPSRSFAGLLEARRSRLAFFFSFLAFLELLFSLRTSSGPRGYAFACLSTSGGKSDSWEPSSKSARQCTAYLALALTLLLGHGRPAAFFFCRLDGGSITCAGAWLPAGSRSRASKRGRSSFSGPRPWPSFPGGGASCPPSAVGLGPSDSHSRSRPAPPALCSCWPGCGCGSSSCGGRGPGAPGFRNQQNLFGRFLRLCRARAARHRNHRGGPLLRHRRPLVSGLVLSPPLARPPPPPPSSPPPKRSPRSRYLRACPGCWKSVPSAPALGDLAQRTCAQNEGLGSLYTCVYI